jgi:signal transduction histidine kinase/CheY-like chemotaxis protein
MTGKRIVYYILAGFIAATIFLVYIQYNSAKNISALISGNEKYSGEYQLNSELKGLEKDIVKIGSNVSNFISTNDSAYVRGIDSEMVKVQDDLIQLQKISDDVKTEEEIDELDSTVQKTLNFNRTLLDSFNTRGKSSAEKIIATLRGKKLIDSIHLISQNVENTRHAILSGLIASTDKNGEKVQRFNTILTALILVCGAVLFWYIIITIRRQLSLIRQLNISEKKVKEGAQVKENFMANMSHEIRTPINAILGFANLLQRKNLDEESKEYIQTIQKSGENLLTIINDILDLSKIEAGMVRVESTPFSIRALLHSIEIMLKPKADEKQLQLSVDVDASVPDTLEGDATRLTQILVNLIGNALKFTSKGNVLISITNEGISGNVIKTGITVSDTGIGVEKEKLQHIFERFQQAEDSVTRKYGGTGLGLSIVKDLVQLQNGTINVESEPGKGTSFKLMIPYKISTDKVISVPVEENSLAAQSDFENVCILVVEDNEINQSLIKHLFKSWDLNYDLANNGAEAIEKLRLKKYELVLMDIQMPEMDGYTATQEIRRNLKLDTPIIAMTAHALAGEREKCLSYGMNEYISKPIREEQLHKLITRFTLVKAPVNLNKEKIISISANGYKYIELQYMKEVSGGNTEYEKTVTEQFIEAIPGDVEALNKAWKQGDITELRQLAHNMKTTISVMGLNEILQPYLDALEYETLDEESFRKKFIALKLICELSVEEAKQFLTTI